MGDQPEAIAQLVEGVKNGTPAQTLLGVTGSGNTLSRLLELDALPIINENDTVATNEIAVGDNDTLAAIVAKCAGADLLVLLTDIEGLYKDINDKSSFISRITASQADSLIEDGFIGGGMLPKLNNCTSAVKNGVNRVHILDGRIPHCLLLEIFTNEGVGTAIVRDED